MVYFYGNRSDLPKNTKIDGYASTSYKTPIKNASLVYTDDAELKGVYESLGVKVLPIIAKGTKPKTRKTRKSED